MNVRSGAVVPFSHTKQGTWCTFWTILELSVALTEGARTKPVVPIAWSACAVHLCKEKTW